MGERNTRRRKIKYQIFIFISFSNLIKGKKPVGPVLLLFYILPGCLASAVWNFLIFFF